MAYRQLPQYVTHLLSAMPTNYNLQLSLRTNFVTKKLS